MRARCPCKESRKRQKMHTVSQCDHKLPVLSLPVSVLFLIIIKPRSSCHTPSREKELLQGNCVPSGHSYGLCSLGMDADGMKPPSSNLPCLCSCTDTPDTRAFLPVPCSFFPVTETARQLPKVISTLLN